MSATPSAHTHTRCYTQSSFGASKTILLATEQLYWETDDWSLCSLLVFLRHRSLPCCLWVCIDPDIKRCAGLLKAVTHCVIFADDYVGFVLGAVGSVSALVTMAAMVVLHSRRQHRWVHTRFTSQNNLLILLVLLHVVFLDVSLWPTQRSQHQSTTRLMSAVFLHALISFRLFNSR